MAEGPLLALLSLVLQYLLRLENHHIPLAKIHNIASSSSDSTVATATAGRMSTSSLLHRPQILLLGDSLTQLSWEGWAATLANVYQRRADIINRGYSGYNTKFYLQLLQQEEPNNDPAASSRTGIVLTIIFFGANDAALLEHDPHHHVPLDEYRANLHRLVDHARIVWNSQHILLVTPPPVHHAQRLDYQKQRYGDKATGILERTLEHTGLYAKACWAVAQQLNVPCLDLYAAMLQADHVSDYGVFLNDGLHFSQEGHAFVAQQVLSTIQTHFPMLHVTPDPKTGQWCNSNSACPNLSSQGPYHDEIDHTNVAAAFK